MSGQTIDHYPTKADRKGVRDQGAVSAIGCVCGDGPVTTEPADNQKVRIICNACWRKTRPCQSAKAAVVAWNAGKVSAPE